MKESLGNKIKRLRIERNMTQDELAKILGYSSRSTINKIESDINTLSYDKLLKLVDVFKIDINELINSAFEERKDNNINEGDNIIIERNPEDKIIDQHSIKAINNKQINDCYNKKNVEKLKELLEKSR